MAHKKLTEVFVSIYTGVSRSGKQWVTRYQGKYLKRFSLEKEAAKYYDDAVRQHLKYSTKVIRVNFPKENEELKKKRKGALNLDNENYKTFTLSKRSNEKQKQLTQELRMFPFLGLIN